MIDLDNIDDELMLLLMDAVKVGFDRGVEAAVRRVTCDYELLAPLSFDLLKSELRRLEFERGIPLTLAELLDLGDPVSRRR
jgi:hypothetical protein